MNQKLYSALLKSSQSSHSLQSTFGNHSLHLDKIKTDVACCCNVELNNNANFTCHVTGMIDINKSGVV